MPEPRCPFIVTVTAQDTVGIIANITTTIAGLGGSVDELSQTVMSGYFTILLAARFPEGTAAETVRASIESAGAPLGLVAIVRMAAGDAAAATASLGDRYVLTVLGDDRAGIIAQIATHLAAQGINIEDFYARAEAGRFIMVLQVQVEGGWTSDHLRLDLEALGEELGLRVHLQHEDIFRATSEVGAVRRLVTHRRSGG
ncbi:amino acid-binding protein [Candidatus Poribacteria bacterium]|nr:amino acid-binding protein [Candidatus Poribacteria bacterium]